MFMREQRPSARRRALAVARATAWDPVTMVMRDGRRVLVRPVRPDDKQRLRGLLGALSPRSRRLRFHGARSTYTEGELRFLTEIDYRHHFAWIALPADAPDGPAVGAARCIREREASVSAELCVEVADAWQAVGLGTKLVELLQLMALEHGIVRFTGHMLPENVPAQGMFRRLGARAGRLSRGLLVKEILATGRGRSLRRSTPSPAA